MNFMIYIDIHELHIFNKNDFCYFYNYLEFNNKNSSHSRQSQQEKTHHIHFFFV